jgi:hypothetical protein
MFYRSLVELPIVDATTRTPPQSSAAPTNPEKDTPLRSNYAATAPYNPLQYLRDIEYVELARGMSPHVYGAMDVDEFLEKLMVLPENTSLPAVPEDKKLDLSECDTYAQFVRATKRVCYIHILKSS